MVLYTSQARTGAGGTVAIENLIDLAVAEANTVYQNSQVHLRVRLVHRSEVQYAEAPNLSTNLNRLQAPADGFLDEVPPLRNTHRADIVCLITESADPGLAGLAFTMGELSIAFQSQAYCIVKRSELVGTYIFAHELGHVMGAQHDPQNAIDEFGKVKLGAFPYSFGHRFEMGGTIYRTVMALAPGIPIPFFSNPNVSFMGLPTGMPGITNGANNALTLNNSAPVVASFYVPHVQTIPPAVSLVTPTNNLVLKASSNLAISALVSDRDSPLQHVEFYADNLLLGKSTVASASDISLLLNTSLLLTNHTYNLTWSNLPPGEFRISARAVDTPGASSLSLPITIIARPQNDSFVDRILLTDAEPAVIGSNRAATFEPGEVIHASNQGGASVWYAWKAPKTGTLHLTAAGNSIVPLPEVYKSLSSTSITTISRDYVFDNSNFVTRTAFDAVAGETYSIVVDSLNAQTGEFTVSWKYQPPPPNDEFINRQLIAGSSIVLSGDTAAASLEPAEPAHAAPNPSNKSVWFSWIAERSSTVILTARATNYFPLLDVYTGSAIADLITVPGRTMTFDQENQSVRLSFNATQGTEYAIALAGFGGGGGLFDFALTVPPPPPNDNFADRIPLETTVTGFAGSNLSSGIETGELQHAGQPASKSVWYSWTALVSGPVTILARGDRFYPLPDIYFGPSLSTLTNVTAKDYTFDNNFNSKVVFDSVAFQTYAIAIDGFNQHSGDFTLTLTPQNSPPAILSASTSLTGKFQLTFSGSTGQAFSIQASTNLIDWSEIHSAKFLDQSASFTDSQSSALKLRFYRVLPLP